MSTYGVNPHLRRLLREAEEIRLSDGSLPGDRVVFDIFSHAEQITKNAVCTDTRSVSRSTRIDNLLTSRLFGYPIMLLLLAFVFWLTVSGANYPSQAIAAVLFKFQDILSDWFITLGAPSWLHGLLVSGLYRTVAWVVSVMLPPMAIFFPIFTLLEDLGYLPRVAFNLDHLFKKARACGKQSLSMCMGFGCNAAGIVSCRIIDSPREKMIAILTNNFVPCNGRFPTLIAIAGIFGISSSASGYSSLFVTAVVTGLVLLGAGITFFISWLLSVTILKGEASSLVLELPPFRRPKIRSVIYRSVVDRTIFVLRRSLMVCAPAGAIIWILGNIYIGDLSLISLAANWLQPLGYALGLDGFIILAFILGLPANEIVLPVLIMSYLSTGYLIEANNIADLRTIFLEHHWTWLTALNTMLFSLLHWPCATTMLTIFKETGSRKWTLTAIAIPTVTSFTVCFLIAQTARLLGLA